MTNTKHKIDIFQVLANLSKKNTEYYDRLEEEQKKAVQPLIVMRWLSGTKSARQIYFLNELVNPFIFSLYNHKGLLCRLMTICTSGKTQRYFWNKALSKRTSKSPEVVKVIKEYFGYNSVDAIEALPLLTNEQILKYADDLGRQKDEVSKIKRELKTR